MKLILSLFLTSSLFLTLGLKKENTVRFKEVTYADGFYTYQDRKLTGEIIDYYEDEVLKFRYRVVDGYLHGTAYEYYHDGSVKTERTYRFNKLHGEYTEFFDSGDVKISFDVEMNAYGGGEKVEGIEFASKPGKKLKDMGNGVLFFFEQGKELDKTSESLSILQQSKIEIRKEEGGKVIYKN
ncbi:toxin-antitoxin system YwqK family antitoxin [Roseivirga pacifica]|jgi:antitoxin component YwqK of YwqJK toxin-antitoxin module|uniref:toxin-antitoxin system YwqK family antitoxin n=1 Tax=Roseivirga pacifica TaxID=1267423 RepID=UPI003BABE0FF